jgi:hypothetical protein
MAKALMEAEAMPDQESFYSEKTAAHSTEIYGLLNQAAAQALEYSKLVQRDIAYSDVSKITFKSTKQKSDNHSVIEKIIDQARLYVVALQPILNAQILKTIINDLITNFERLMGVSVDELSMAEQEALRHLLTYTMGKDDQQTLGVDTRFISHQQNNTSQ